MSRFDGAIAMLLDELEELERSHASGAVDDDEFARLHDRTTARVASLIRAGQKQTATQRQRSGTWRIVVPTAGVVVLVGAVYGVYTAALDRAEPSLPAVTIESAAPEPIDRDTMLNDAARAAEQGLLVEAAERYSALLDADPDDSRALTYYGWMLSRAAASDSTFSSMARDGLALLDRAIIADPELPEARWFRAVVRSTNGDIAGASADLDAFLDLNPAAAKDRVVLELQAHLEEQRARGDG